ncbi:MAG: ring-cleaving dioxygenase [Candidatus Peribacteraceae bacterium]|nr:ring-cleaving dioxygenase [Candidatus Peribacteraceae bacterium]
MNLLGFHHLTAIASDAQRNYNFYTNILGLRLVKVTINFDDPSAYHLYYGDGVGTPGTILTFFIWKNAYAGRAGAGQTIAAALSIPQASFGYWLHRLQEKGVPPLGPFERFGEKFILLKDPDGMTVELVADPEIRTFDAWAEGPVPVEHAVRGLHGITLLETGFEETSKFLTSELNMIQKKEELGTFRYSFSENSKTYIDLKCAPDYFASTMGTGSIHHIALATEDDATQVQWLKSLSNHGHNASPVMDREYFHSIYFREPGGALFEIATQGPGFTVDEPREKLGTSLQLPPWMEKDRVLISSMLPPLPQPNGQ